MRENGNGRFARLWAAMELIKVGYPVPVGFPTNDFMMSQRHIELEVRRAVALGRMWESMLKEAKQSGISTEQFFQKVYRGSALEGLTHVSPPDIKELAVYVSWLEQQTSPPEWGKELMKNIERRLYEFHSTGGRLAKITEADRARLLAESWKVMAGELQKRGVLNLQVQCSALFKGI